MNARGKFVAELLDASSAIFASRAVSRIAQRSPEHRKMVETWGFRLMVNDLEARLKQLGEALAVGRPELFRSEIQWVASTLVARGVPVGLLVEQLSALAEELGESLPEDSARAAVETLEEARCKAGEPVAFHSALPTAEPEASFARRLLLAAVEGRRSAAERVVAEALEAGIGLADLHETIVAAVLSEIGRLWQTGDLSVALEHMAAGVLEDLLASLRQRFPAPSADAHSVLVACVPGNQHDIGARLVADRFELSDWRVFFLGANLPASDLIEALAEFDPDVLGLSAGLALHLRSTAACIESVRAAGWRRPILVGGRAFHLLPDLWRDVGASGEARDAEAAVLAAASWMRR